MDLPTEVIALSIYSIIMTLVVIVTITYIVLLRKRYKPLTVCKDAKAPEDLQTLNRRSTNNEYRVDFPHSPLIRTRSAPLTPSRNRVVSEYDVENSASNQPETSDAMNHQYEEIKNPKPQNHYEQIIEHVASTLSVVYSEAGMEGNVYTRFMTELMNKIKENSSALYQSIQEGKQSDGEADYAIYLPKQNGKVLTPQEMGATLGSTDHLKYLVACKNCAAAGRDSAPYLLPRNFKPTSDCPEKIKKLCPTQKETYGARSIDPSTPSTSGLNRSIRPTKQCSKSAETLLDRSTTLDESISRTAPEATAAATTIKLAAPSLSDQNRVITRRQISREDSENRSGPRLRTQSEASDEFNFKTMREATASIAMGSSTPSISNGAKPKRQTSREETIAAASTGVQPTPSISGQNGTTLKRQISRKESVASDDFNSKARMLEEVLKNKAPPIPKKTKKKNTKVAKKDKRRNRSSSSSSDDVL